MTWRKGAISLPAAVLAVALCVLTLLPAHAGAQEPLRGKWVTRTEDRIEKHRKAQVRIVVLDAQGNAAQGALVRIEQQAHAFPFGFTVDEDGQWPEAIGDGAPVWRCFNAVSLDRLTAWQRMRAQRDAALDTGAIAPIVRRAQQQGMLVRFGEVISADVGRNPDWVAGLDDSALETALNDRLNTALRETPGPIAQYDLYTHVLDHQFIEDRFGAAMVRQLFERARVLAPRAAVGMRYQDCLVGARLREMAQHVLDMRHNAIPVDTVAIEQRMSQLAVPAQMERAFEWLNELNLDVSLVNLEIGGSSQASAAYNMEVLLRLAFASPNVQGVWLANVRADDASAPSVGLIDRSGQPTRAGRVVERLLRETWWTNQQHTADGVGNVRTSVFAGVHRISAELAGGETMSMTVRVPMPDDVAAGEQAEPRMIVLEPMKTSTTQPADASP